MPKRISKRLDTVQNARRVVELSTQAKPNSETISQVMAEMGRKGGRIGGKRRLVTLSNARRREIASQAAKARWASKQGKKG